MELAEIYLGKPIGIEGFTYSNSKLLTDEECKRLSSQNDRIVSEHKARMLEIDAKKHWDLFYKRNGTRFFKDRHWTTREFHELLDDSEINTRVLFEVGCGVGNFIFPLIEDDLNFKVKACDLSPRAVEIVRKNPKFNPDQIEVFQCDITTNQVFEAMGTGSVDIITLIFVLSAIHPDKFSSTLSNLCTLLKPGGILLFRDYGLYDMAQFRFKPGNKIANNFYMRQDGTRSYYFSTDEIARMLKESGFKILGNTYVNRRTINIKEDIDVPRIFIQCKARKL